MTSSAISRKKAPIRNARESRWGWNAGTVFTRVAGALLVLTVGCGGGGLSNALSSSSAAPSQVDALHRYEGPSVAFDVPEAWHEFYLDVSFKFFAAYGPIEGGKSDYVAVAPVPPDLAQRPSTEILGHLMPPADRIDRVRVVDVNGLPAFSVSGTTGKDLEGELTVVEGRQGVYFVTCQSVREMRDEVTRGCGSDQGVPCRGPSLTYRGPAGLHGAGAHSPSQRSSAGRIITGEPNVHGLGDGPRMRSLGELAA